MSTSGTDLEEEILQFLDWEAPPACVCVLDGQGPRCGEAATRRGILGCCGAHVLLCEVHYPLSKKVMDSGAKGCCHVCRRPDVPTLWERI